MTNRGVYACALVLLHTACLNAQFAPPSGFDEYVFPDFLDHRVAIHVDAAQQQLEIQSQVDFTLSVAGRPLFDLKPAVDRYRIHLGPVAASDWIAADLLTVLSPDHQTTFRSLPHSLAAGTRYTISMQYRLRAEDTARCRFESAVFHDGTSRKLVPALHFLNGKENAGTATQVDFMMALMDYQATTFRTDGRTFLERYLPASQEADFHPLTISVRITGTTQAHRIMANGQVEGLSVSYPEHSSASSVYFHLIPEDRYRISQSIGRLGNQAIPIEFYSLAAAGDDFHAKLLAKVEEAVTDTAEQFGFYPHAKFVAQLYPKSGGMEYAGATSCGPSALRHEVFHSWFGRGVRPKDGNAGWIDEAVAVWWVDQRAELLPLATEGSTPLIDLPSLYRHPRTPMVGNSAYPRMTPSAAYRQGALFIKVVASLYWESGGELKPVLVEFALQHMHRPVTTEEFVDCLRNNAPQGVDLQPAIDYLIYAR